jgi:hypothetical protein
MFDMFQTKKEMKDYLQILRESFAQCFRGDELLISQGMEPTYSNDNNIYACIYLCYQPILRNRGNGYACPV